MRESFCKYLDFFDSNNYFYCSFPREDEGSPRQAILAQFCEADVTTFRACMAANDFNENKCLETKGILDKCASGAFKKVNGNPEFVFWASKNLLA